MASLLGARLHQKVPTNKWWCFKHREGFNRSGTEYPWLRISAADGGELGFTFSTILSQRLQLPVSILEDPACAIELSRRWKWSESVLSSREANPVRPSHGQAFYFHLCYIKLFKMIYYEFSLVCVYSGELACTCKVSLGWAALILWRV
jgi:hypothetical protein